MTHSGIIFVLLAFCVISSDVFANQQRTKAEESACWELLEDVAFKKWQKHARGYKQSIKLNGYKYRPIEFATRDGRKLIGYRVDRINAGENARAIIVAQGNAVLADHLTNELPYFAKRGYSVFSFDYRGYGNSTGVSGVKVIIDDYKEIFEFVKSHNFKKIFAYGMSFGGIVLLGASGRGEYYDAMVIDSSPSTLPLFAFCPDRFDPIQNLPADTSHLMVISGSNDSVISEAEVMALAEKVRKGGGQWLQTEFHHPLMENSRDKALRFNKVIEFFNKF